MARGVERTTRAVEGWLGWLRWLRGGCGIEGPQVTLSFEDRVRATGYFQE
jgi:hypothetical protein